ncbi:O-acetyl-ADP-ribose deacetylase [Cutibacterium sp. WCA-380-WT-3A]|uniref:O-acetyl-ADP-ribose deacetylase n=1 Tax=Cutibacterium porci TaxID=2605781 RepID=A0A7K0J573_9ACTN|nr:O-acetyl-ADP-ribose deacetylase [Cutibacterium porci]MSS45086.1 O-acetyl-ADP-ribose deacetylase [Cutibacterium porci]
MADITVLRADITTLDVEAIVNAANRQLAGGGGVDGAIHHAAGPELSAACQRLRETTLPDGLPTGQSVATTAGRMPAKWVIHTVGPVWAKTIDKSDQLASCYRTSLQVADDIGARTIAFPTISAGVYGYPIDEATRIAVKTCQQTTTKVETIYLVAFNAEAEAGYRAALKEK